MQYLTDIHALNLPCRLRTTGDWHTSALRWGRLIVRDSNDSVFGDWGIELEPLASIPNHPELHIPVANHLRAVADILEQGRFTLAPGFKNDWIDVDDYDDELMEHVLMLRSLPTWPRIDQIMKKEYGRKWLSMKTGKSSTKQ